MVNNALIAGLSKEIMTYQATFTVTLMFGSYNDIWVPLGYFTWTVNMGAGEGSGGNWDNVFQATTNTSYTSSTAYPNWIESNYCLWNTYRSIGANVMITKSHKTRFGANHHRRRHGVDSHGGHDVCVNFYSDYRSRH